RSPAVQRPGYAHQSHRGGHAADRLGALVRAAAVGRPLAALTSAMGQSTQTKMNSATQTTSTKCQYQAAASKPKWFSGVKWPLCTRISITVRMIAPMVTWKP